MDPRARSDRAGHESDSAESATPASEPTLSAIGEPTMSTVSSGPEYDEDLATIAELAEMGLSDAVQVGRGGFGVVYRCLQPALDRVVAVKVLSVSDMDTESRERFLREEQAMGKLSGHPNIVEVLQVDVTPSGLPFIVMPYNAGGSLEVVVREHGPLPWSEALRIAVKLAGAIESAHRAGILHRDVKPGNVLLSPYGEPQLTDFGIARIPGGFRTSSRMIAGSPAFTAPEVLEGAGPEVASDVYGLGATLFALITGHAAFERRVGEKVVAQFLRITTQPIPDLRKQDIPADFASAIEHAMAQEPQDRPATAYEFGESLRAVQIAHGEVPDEMALLDTETDDDVTAAEPVDQDNTAHPAVPAQRSWPLYLNPTAPQPPGTTRTEPADHPSTPVSGALPPTAATKFRPPTPTKRPMVRPRLLELLGAGERRTLVVIHAPAGFGKSTLATQWRDELAAWGMGVAWIGIDSGDNNAIWFLAHLIRAIRRVRPDIGSGLEQVLEERPADAEEFVVTILIDEIHGSGKAILVVIDDWQRVTDAGTLQVMDTLLDRGCHHLRFVVTSRDRTGLPISRMRVRDELVEIGSADLRLTRSETEQILRRHNDFDLDEQQLDRIHRATDGWPAAVRLVGVALRDHVDAAQLTENLTDGGHGIGEYLAENVLDTLEPRMLEFLSDISITEKVSGSLAAALSGAADAERLLERAEERELFLQRVDYDPEWFRMQPLFAEHLRTRLERNRPGRLRVQHRKAARWFAEHQLLRKSVDHALAATDLKMALDLLESGGMELIDASRLATLLGSVSKLPVQQVASRSKLLMAVARANVNLQQSGAARNALGRLSNVLSRESATDADIQRQRCEAAVLTAADEISHDRTDGVAEAVADCLAHPGDLPDWAVSTAANVTTYVRLCEFDFGGAARMQDWAQQYHQRSNDPLGEVFGLGGRGLIAYERLHVAEALDYFRQSYETARLRSGPRSHGVRVAAALLGELEYRRGALDTADQLLDQSHQLVARVGPIESLVATFVIGARTKALLGDPEAAAERLVEGARIAAHHRLTRLAAQIEAECLRLGPAVRFSVGSENYQESGVASVDNDATTTARQRAQLPTGAMVLGIEAEELLAVRRLLTTGGDENLDRAVRRARALCQRAHEKHRPRAQLDMTLLLVESLTAAGWVGEAAALLAPVLSECAQLHWTRPLVDSGSGVLDVVRVLRDDLPCTTSGAPDDEPVRNLGQVRLPARFLDQLLD